MTSTALNDQFAVCTPEEEEAFRAIEARQEEQGRRTGSEQQSSQRERFERKCGYYPWSLPMERWESTGEYVNLETRRAWNLWQAACPEGWQPVPDTADEEMLREGVESLKRGHKLFGDNLTQIVSNIHEDMLAAAPKPEDV